MYEIGDYVVYGNKGVCRIEKIGPIDIPGMSSERQYYTMSQIYSRASTIFTPVDNADASLRKVLSEAEATKLIYDMIEFKPVWIQNDKEREQRFTETLRSADPLKLFEMIAMLAHRRDQRIAGGKKATSTDERMYHAAEDILYGEFAISLGRAKEEVKAYVLHVVGKEMH